MTAVSLTFALAQVYFGPLDAGEDLVEERLVLGLLALVLQERRRAGESAAGRDARSGAVSGLDGFVTVLVGGLLAALQQLIILHLRDIILIKRKSQNCVRISPEYATCSALYCASTSLSSEMPLRFTASARRMQSCSWPRRISSALKKLSLLHRCRLCRVGSSSFSTASPRAELSSEMKNTVSGTSMCCGLLTLVEAETEREELGEMDE